MAKELMAHFYREFIADGLLEVAGKSESEIRKDFARELRRFAKQQTIFMSIDHTPSLLENARYYRRRKSYEDACLFYATWFEHWINGILARKLANTGLLTRENFQVLIRGTNLRVKYECLPQLCNLPPIPAKHCSTVEIIAQLRNSYVHYKHTPGDINNWSAEDKRWARPLTSASQSVHYLLKYEEKNIYHGLKHPSIPQRKNQKPNKRLQAIGAKARLQPEP